MKVLIFDDGKGLASYTCELANALAELGLIIYYMSAKINHRRKDLNPKILDCCILEHYNLNYKQYSVKWFFNRFYVLIKYCEYLFNSTYG